MTTRHMCDKCEGEPTIWNYTIEETQYDLCNNCCADILESWIRCNKVGHQEVVYHTFKLANTEDNRNILLNFSNKMENNKG